MEILSDWKKIQFEEILDLYNAVGWEAYTQNPESLERAFSNSTYVIIARVDECVVGLARSISDEVSIHYLQDILVHPEFQKKGIGRKLLNLMLERFENVRTHMILTDDEEKQLKFYESLGYKNTRGLKKVPLNTFVKMKGVELC
tara:strand:- start:92 stop:523 length:432 start_codon:yes stop_codon:yes gene_type:complete